MPKRQFCQSFHRGERAARRPSRGIYGTASSAVTATATTGTIFFFQITAYNTPTGYTATGLPAGLSLNTTSGLISGIPTITGTFSIALGATNAGGTGTATFSLTVAQSVPAVTRRAFEGVNDDLALPVFWTA